MVCNNCNTLNSSSAKKCEKCGVKLSDEKVIDKAQKKKKLKNAIDTKREKDNTFIDYSKNKTSHQSDKKKSSSLKLLIVLVVLAVAYYIYDREKINKFWTENEDLAPYLEKVSNAVNEYTDSLNIGVSFKNAPKDEKIDEEEKIQPKETKTSNVSNEEYDYYNTMKDNNIPQSKTPEDTIKYISSSDAEEAQKLLKKNKKNSKVIYGKDNKKMVLVPTQQFIMGNNEGADHEKPEHKVDTPAFFMDVFEVTNSEFLRFLDESKYKPTGKLAHLNEVKFNSELHPVVDVSYEDALAYATFYEKRLPTEAEWECAAKGGTNLAYPTGETISKSLACYGNNIKGNPKLVGSYRPNNYGIYDLAGNVTEWITGFMFAYPGNATSSPAYENIRFSRGGSWNSPEKDVKSSRRTIIQLSNSSGKRGFRCVVSR